MWETFISWYINAYLGNYLENLNSAQLSFALRQGELELENVPLKKNIFRGWGLPIEISSSVVGRVKVEFNLMKYLRNEPVLVTIEDIYLVAGSINLANWNPLDEEALVIESKMNALDGHEGRWKAQFDLAANSSSYYSSLYFSSLRIGASIVTKVVENLQLNVKNVHIRFEEVLDGKVIAFGITLESLTAESCDSKWTPNSSSATTTSSDYSYKTLQLNNFGIYCDTKTQRFSNVQPQDLRAAMNDSCVQHNYLVCPVSAEARITKNNANHPLTNGLQPRFNVQILLERVPLQLTESQYRSIHRAVKAFHLLRRNCHLRQFRPYDSVQANSKAWWMYASRAVLTLRGYKQKPTLRDWEDILERGRDNVAYVDIYQQHLLGDCLPVDSAKVKERIELDQHFDEIVALREIAMRRVESIRREKEVSTQPDLTSESRAPTAPSSGSMFSFLFPSWTKWVSSSAAPHPTGSGNSFNEEDSLDLDETSLDLRRSEAEFDEAILDEAKSFGSDALLARFNFGMRRSLITLTRGSGPFLELDVGGIELLAELKPRSGSHKFKMSVGSLFLRECSTKSVVISPHPFAPVHRTLSGSRAKPSEEKTPGHGANRDPIFSVLYERKPSKRFGHRLVMKTRPLDLVFFPKIWDDVRAYFAIADYQPDELELTENRYELMKQKTKEELRLYWERLISLRESKKQSASHSHSWDILLDISAPQIVMHGSLSDVASNPRSRASHRSTLNTNLNLTEEGGRFLVIDLGKFRFTNQPAQNDDSCFHPDSVAAVAEEEEVEEDEEFLTPCSSPIQPELITDVTSISSPTASGRERRNSIETELGLNDSLGDLQAKLYKKYRLEITDVQVLVVDGRSAPWKETGPSAAGSWRAAITKGVSPIHLIDRFSINMALERRLIYSEDPAWPALTLVATLPKLNFHLNESKITTMQFVLNSFARTRSQPEQLPPQERLRTFSGSQMSLNSRSNTLNETTTAATPAPPKPITRNAQHFVAQFTIQHITAEIQSEGRSIAELQIVGAKTTYKEMSLDTSITFVIKSLLLADAIQTFGPDYELLLASHKHVSMDSVSGSLRDSDPTSPIMSPESPSSPLSFAHPKLGGADQLAAPSQLHEALVSSLEGSRKGKSRVRGSVGAQSPPAALEELALITARLVLMNNGQEAAELQVRCNNLDVIANQETLVEILQFIQRVSPPATSSFPTNFMPVPDKQVDPEGSSPPPPSSSPNLQASFEFHRLSCLLLRAVVGKDGSQSARKIATMTACDAKVTCSLGDENIIIEGSLGGLQMLNLTAEGQYHQRVLSVGKDLLVDSTYDILKGGGNYHPTKAELFNETALSFAFNQHQGAEKRKSKVCPSFTLRMASVIYTHCPVFLVDLKKCIDQFQAPLANKLKSAAAQIAFGLVRQETSGSGSGGYNSPFRSLSGSLEHLNEDELDQQQYRTNYESLNAENKTSCGVELDIVLDSPVIVLPRHRTSAQVLVANLGQITILGNTDNTTNDAELSKLRPSTPDCPGIERSDGTIQYNVFICDISLFSLDLKDKWEMVENLKMTYPTTSYTTLLRAQELYYCDPATSTPILHNTIIHLSIDYTEGEGSDLANWSTLLGPSLDFDDGVDGPKLRLQGRVVNSLKLSLTPQQYAQILDSLENVAASEEAFTQSEVSVTSASRKLNWEKELQTATTRAKGRAPLLPEACPLPSPTTNVDDSLPISAIFEIPEVIAELVLPQDQIPSATSPHLVLSASELLFDCDKSSPTMELKISLRSLILEDFSAPLDSMHRVLAVSKTSSDPTERPNSVPAATNLNQTSTFLSEYFRSSAVDSYSCSDLPNTTEPIDIGHHQRVESPAYSSPVARSESSSLPDRLDPRHIFTARFYPHPYGFSSKKSFKTGTKMKPELKRNLIPGSSSSCPVTPPPSPRPFESGENLVQIQMTFVNPKCMAFLTKFKGTHKFTVVDFNTLEVFLSPNTFSQIRRFFSEASCNSTEQQQQREKRKKPETSTWTEHSSASAQQQQLEQNEIKNSELKLAVKALRIKIGAADKVLAVGDVIGFQSEFVNRGDNFTAITGKLGSLQIRDESPTAGFYPVKFVFQGDQAALDFDYCRRDNNATLRLEMACALCVHTQRFYTEFSTLVSEIFGSSGQSGAETEEDDHGHQTQTTSSKFAKRRRTRTHLNVQAGAPVLLLPYNANSKSILVADLGHLSVKNLETTNAYECIAVDLIEMDLYSAVLTDVSGQLLRRQQATLQGGGTDGEDLHKIWKLNKKLVVVSAGRSSSYLKNKCALNLKVTRALDHPTCPTQPLTGVRGTLSTVYITLDSDKYKLVRGILNHNIGENIVNTIEKPRVKVLARHHRRSTAESADLIIRSPPPLSTPSSQVELSIDLELVNVSMELIKDDGGSLCQTFFLKSKLNFQSNSEGTKDVGLVSQEIVIADARNSRDSENQNVFVNILQPSTQGPLVAAPEQKPGTSLEAENGGTLQAEVHLRQTVSGSNVTVILNNMRLMVVIDWWMEFHSFLSQSIPSPGDDDAISGGSSEVKYEPIAVSAGIVTKRAPILDVPSTTFELKINISKCELVVIENPAAWDTNAIILKSTAVTYYRPHLEHPVYVNLLSCEVFSCVLGLESETALSIVDPTKNIVFEVVKKSSGEPLGLLDAAGGGSFTMILKVQSPQLNLRLSYYDMKMFVQLLERFSKDAQVHLFKSDKMNCDDSDQPNEEPTTSMNMAQNSSIDTLMAMGFTREDSAVALLRCDGKLDNAALILSSGQLHDASLSPEPPDRSRRKESKHSNDNDSVQTSVISGTSDTSDTKVDGGVRVDQMDAKNIGGVEVKCSGVSLCIIDDCKDADVPLLEFTVAQFELSQSFTTQVARLEGVLSGDYYNRQLSGWEPFLEPWKCSLTWKQNEYGQLGQMSPLREFPVKLPRQELNLISSQVMNINLTSTLLKLYETVSLNWSEEYQKLEKRRSPFIPFALKNETGSPLWFTTILSSNEDIFRQHKLGTSHADGTNWMQVNNGRAQSFSFEGRGKLRHRNTHQLKTHQLVVQVDGWQESTPVSVDKVGTYFRMVKPISLGSSQPQPRLLSAELPPIRLIFEVSLQGSAQKLVRVRSALLVKNELPDAMELKLENTIVYPGFQKAQTGGSITLLIEPGVCCPVPLHSVCAQMWVRPHRTPDLPSSPSLYMYCTKPMVLGDRDSDGLRTCSPMIANQSEPYRFCVAAKHDQVPIDYEEPSQSTSFQSAAQLLSFGMSRRPNLLILKSPLVVSNLLPLEIFFQIKNSGLTSRIAPGKQHLITNVDTSQNVDISFRFDNFPNETSIAIPANGNSFVARLKALDLKNRPLYLDGKVERKDGGSIRVSLSCPYWIINRSGIPLICKQEGTTGEAAGQFQEHEMGRMATPLLFNFSDFDKASTLALRVGNSLHGASAKSHWCRALPLQRESVRKLAVTLSHAQPEALYVVGISVRDGKGRYKDTKLVTITPRFIIDNRSTKAVQISQLHFATSFVDPTAEATQLTLPTDCSLPFHWPRLDKDLLLCVKILNLSGNNWSGGFLIEQVDSFHINIRDADGNCYFLRVETVLQGPTYVVVFSDTDKLPAPFRVDNLSLVPITFHQSSVGDDRKLSIRAESSCPYAWDEIIKPPHLTVVAPGGTSAIVNMNHLGLVGSLSYENFFYIGLTATFPRDNDNNSSGLQASGMETSHLVLDVAVGSKVILAQKEPGKRSQLWRINSDGLIEHEGSSPPRDLRKPAHPGSILVLDIAGAAPQPSSYVPLMLRKPDTRRASTQHWEFTQDGRLKCANYSSLFVQAKDGFEQFGGLDKQSNNEGSWRQWADIVLGPPASVVFVRTETGIPVEQAITPQKLRAGSGRLELFVDTDGPTRVLRIIDPGKRPTGPLLNHTFEDNYVNSIPNFILNVNLFSGLGASIVNCNPREELLYIRLFALQVKWSDSKESETVEVAVHNLQIDNQLLDAEKAVCVFVTPASRYNDDEIAQPALLLNWRKLKSRLNANVYRNWMLTLKPLSIILEETLLLKFCNWIGLATDFEPEREGLKEPDLQVQQAVANATSVTAKRWYFGFLRIVLNQVRLSVLTASKLPPELQVIKRRLGLTLIRFEEALVELDPFEKEHPFETFEFLTASLVKHYKDELLSQAVLILGSVDFLGNPVGFVNDISVGVSGLIHEGSVGSLIRNVTHGISNSAAKVTGSLGDGLGRTLALDDKHELQRRRIIQESNSSSGEQFAAGLRGLTHGVVGGLTSIFTQTYEGVTTDGFSGLITGLGKGIVGTVTKPAVGVLDLASGTALAIRDSSKTSSRRVPRRLRPTRVIGSGGILPSFSDHYSHGQELLFELNNRNYNEQLIGYETFKSGAQQLQILVSTEHVRLLNPNGNSKHSIVLHIHLKDLIECQVTIISEPDPTSFVLQRRHYIEFMKRISDVHLSVARPQVLVDNEQIAKKIVQQVNYAKIIFEEMKHSLIVSYTSDNNDD